MRAVGTKKTQILVYLGQIKDETPLAAQKIKVFGMWKLQQKFKKVIPWGYHKQQVSKIHCLFTSSAVV